MKNKNLFKESLKRICKRRGTSFKELAEKLKIKPSALYILGSQKGISWNRLIEIFKILKLNQVEKDELAANALFATPRPIISIKINNDFINAVTQELWLRNADWQHEKAVCHAVLKFYGARTRGK